MGPKILGCRVGGKPFEQTIESPQSVVESLRTEKVSRFREKRLPLLIGLILTRAFQELGNFRIPRKLLLHDKEKADALLILEIRPKGPGAMKDFVPLLSPLAFGAFLADLFELFAGGCIPGVQSKHFVELQLRIGERAFRHPLLGSAQRPSDVEGAFDGGLRLAKEFTRRLES